MKCQVGVLTRQNSECTDEIQVLRGQMDCIPPVFSIAQIVPYSSLLGWLVDSDVVVDGRDKLPQCDAAPCRVDSA